MYFPFKKNKKRRVFLYPPAAGGQGDKVSACAGLTNQMQSRRFDPRIACLENTDSAMIADWWTGVGAHHSQQC